jgi:predicted metal-dependent peptidase
VIAISNVNVEALRMKARTVAPYFGTVIWGLRPFPKPGIGTFAVTADGRFVYDPEVPWSFNEQVGAFIHELHHVVLFHSERANGREKRMWNAATDLEINSALKRGGILLPDGALYPELLGLPDNMSAEFYYAEIQKQEPEKQPQKPDDVKPGNGRCGSVAGDKEDFEPAPDEGNPMAGQQPGQSQQAGTSPGETPAQPTTGQSEVEINAMRQEVAKEVMRNMGTAPGNLVEWAKNLLNPTVQWQAILRSAVKRAVHTVAGGASDYSYSRTNDRTLDPDLILPTLITKKPEVTCIIDTSGSISRAELMEALSEVKGVIRSHSNRLTLIACDTRIHEVYTVSPSSKIDGLRFSGGGGTNLRVAFDYAMKDVRPKPNIIIVFTDAFTPWPDKSPNAEVIVCLNRQGLESQVPAWAKSMRIGGK